MHGEGEATFAELLDALDGVARPTVRPTSRCCATCPGSRSATATQVVRTGERDRIADLDIIPSPYLTGCSTSRRRRRDRADDHRDNRGCPYGCTFCDWGSATLSRIRKFDLDRVFAELEWCATAQRAARVFCADANFGIFERDVEIAEKVAELKREYGYPKLFESNYAKNTVKHLRQIIEILADAGILAQGMLSLQTMDAEHARRRSAARTSRSRSTTTSPPSSASTSCPLVGRPDDGPAGLDAASRSATTCRSASTAR